MMYTFFVHNLSVLPQDGQRLISYLDKETKKLHHKNYRMITSKLVDAKSTYETFNYFCKKFGHLPHAASLSFIETKIDKDGNPILDDKGNPILQ